MKRFSTIVVAVLTSGLVLTAPSAPAGDKGRDKAMESVVEGTAHHQTVLEDKMQTAPAEAQSGLETAIENSSKGQSGAIDGLERRNFDGEEEWGLWDRERSGQSFDQPTRRPRRK